MKDRTRILVVDDETGLCDFISHYLKSRDYDVQVAFRAKEALDKLQQESFDVVLADIMMPTMDGLEMLRRIKEANPQTVVIMMTAYASLDKAMKAITYGAADLLIKPFELSQLTQVIARNIKDSSLFTSDSSTDTN